VPPRSQHEYSWDDDADDLEEAGEWERDSGARARPSRSRRRDRPPRSGKRSGQDDVAGEYDELDTSFDDVADLLERKARERRKADISEPFKCRNCRAFIGMPPTGGQQRNHCPMCLYSLHVDGRTPGDRASDCRSLMEPIGVFYRRNMEQVLVHRCLGCGFVRYNRIAADDNPILLSELPVIDPPVTDRME
jgi:hypothetical protein